MRCEAANRWALFVATVVAFSSAAEASTSGQIALRGTVPARATINVLGLARPMVVDFQNFRDGTAVFRLNRFTNSASGVTVSLASSAKVPRLRGLGGEAVSYVVRFAGRDVDLSDGAAQLVTTSRKEASGANDDELQIVAPPTTLGAGRNLVDYLVLIITAQ